MYYYICHGHSNDVQDVFLCMLVAKILNVGMGSHIDENESKKNFVFRKVVFWSNMMAYRPKLINICNSFKYMDAQITLLPLILRNFLYAMHCAALENMQF